MNMPESTTRDATDMQEGDDFTCQYCGCEIRLVRHGEPEKMQRMGTFTCCCGTRMDRESRSAA